MVYELLLVHLDAQKSTPAVSAVFAVFTDADLPCTGIATPSPEDPLSARGLSCFFASWWFKILRGELSDHATDESHHVTHQHGCVGSIADVHEGSKPVLYL